MVRVSPSPHTAKASSVASSLSVTPSARSSPAVSGGKPVWKTTFCQPSSPGAEKDGACISTSSKRLRPRTAAPAASRFFPWIRQYRLSCVVRLIKFPLFGRQAAAHTAGGVWEPARGAVCAGRNSPPYFPSPPSYRQRPACSSRRINRPPCTVRCWL